MVFKWANFIHNASEIVFDFLSMWNKTKKITLFLTSHGTKYDKDDLFSERLNQRIWKCVGSGTLMLMLLKEIQSLQNKPKRKKKTRKKGINAEIMNTKERILCLYRAVYSIN